MISPPAPSADIRYLALGDSYTIGESVAASRRWPEQLAAALRAHGLKVAAPQIVARTGWTTDELSTGIDAAHVDGSYGLVTLLIGVNDQYRGRSSSDYEPRFRALLARAIAFAGGKAPHVIVVSIPDWGVTPFAEGRDRARIAADIDAFNAIAKREAERAGARYVDITLLSRHGAADRTLIAPDGLHPSAAAYTEWVDKILPVALVCLA